MKREIALRIVALLWLLVPSSSILGDELSGRSPATATPPPIVTRQRLFSIPFYLNPQARPPQEVLLYVSGDQGRAWSLYQRRRAIDGKFDFQAGGDGEFWFCVRTDQDSLPPTDKAQPEKVVVVDTAEPEMSMNIQVSPSGFLKGRWRVLDPNLDASTFQLQYQLAGEDRWRPVTVDLPARQVAASQYEGEASWTVEQRQGMIGVRVEVLDRAGNSATWEDRIELAPLAQQRSPAELELPPAAVPQDQNQGRDQSQNQNQDAVAVDHPAPALPWEVRETAAGPRQNPDAWPSDRQEVWDSWRPGSSGAPLGLASLNGGGDKGQAPVGASPQPAPADFVFRSHDVSGPAVQTSPWSGTPTGPHGSDTAFHSSGAGAITGRPEIRLRPERQVPLTASARFHLDYDLVDIDRADVSRVELWITSDDGQSWAVYGTDPDLESPFEVDVPREGIYGFRLLIHDHDGSVARPPQPGDQADLWVGVDRSRPQAALTSARFVPEAGGPLLEVTWEASDAHLTDSPIRLSYAASAQGPWIPLTADLPNSGRYRWHPESPLPDKIFLQIEVHDRAGNVTRQQLSDPIATREIQPQGRIRRFEPVEE